MRGENADDGMGLAIELKQLAYCSNVAGEMSLPEVITDDDARLVT